MTMMRTSCLVTIQPTITPQGCERLADAVTNKLWPGNAGGVVLAFHRKTTALLAPLCMEVIERNQAVEVRVVRDGVTLTLEPVERQEAN